MLQLYLWGYCMPWSHALADTVSKTAYLQPGILRGYAPLTNHWRALSPYAPLSTPIKYPACQCVLISGVIQLFLSHSISCSPHRRIGDEEILYDGHDNVETTSGVTLTSVKTEGKEDLSKPPPTDSSQLNYQNPLYNPSEFGSHEYSTTPATQPSSQTPAPILGQYQPLEDVPEKVQNPIYEVTEFETVPEKVEPSPEDFAPPPDPVEPSTDQTAEKYEPATPVAIDVETEPQYATVLPKHKRATAKPFAADDDEGSDDDELLQEV